MVDEERGARDKVGGVYAEVLLVENDREGAIKGNHLLRH